MSKFIIKKEGRKEKKKVGREEVRKRGEITRGYE